MGYADKFSMPTKEQALPGRGDKMPVAAKHAVLGTPMEPPFAEGSREAPNNGTCQLDPRQGS